MAFPLSFGPKKAGDLIKHEEWNEMREEIDKRVKIAGDTMTGPLTINTPAAGQPQLSLSGGNWDVGTTEGDLRIGTATHRLKIGVATSGGGAGDARIRAMGGTNRLMLGAGSSDLCVLNSNGSTTFHGPSGETQFAIYGADLILSARTNPNWHVVNADNTRGNGKLCRALVNWKADANSPDELHINWANDFSGGTFIDSRLEVRYGVAFTPTLAGQNKMDISMGALSYGLIVLGGGSPPANNLIVEMASITSGQAVPAYKFAVGHWVRQNIQFRGDFQTRFSVDQDGNARCDGSFIGGGADYAELLESENGRQLPVGTAVAFNPEGKIRPAKSHETPMGIVSTMPAMLGNNPSEWPKKYVQDDMGRIIMENGVPKLNPDYDETLVYQTRDQRPEWNKVGILGQLHLKKGQPTAPSWIKIKDISEQVELWLVK